VSRTTRWTLLLATTVALLAVIASSPALAIYPQLSTKLSGTAIKGVVPRGDAKIDQSGVFERPLTLEVKVQNVNLPNGTVLSVILTDCGTSPVGTITLSRRQGELRTTVPGCQVGRTSAIHVNSGSTRILTGGSPWKV
jgi:hypothetical protein